MLGSLVLIPLVIVPAMGGTHVSSSELFPWTSYDNHSLVENILWFILIWFDLVGLGGYFTGGVHSAICFRSNHSFAHVIWVKVAFDTGPIICLSCSSTGNNQFPWVSKTKWKCKFRLFRFVLVKTYKSVVVFLCLHAIGIKGEIVFFCACLC